MTQEILYTAPEAIRIQKACESLHESTEHTIQYLMYLAKKMQHEYEENKKLKEELATVAMVKSLMIEDQETKS
jgi:hypothetical protein